MLKKEGKEIVESDKVLSTKNVVTIQNAKVLKLGTLPCVEVKVNGEHGILPITKIAPLGFLSVLKSVITPRKSTDARVNTLNEQITELLKEINTQRAARTPRPQAPLSGLTFVIGNKRYRDISFAVEAKKVRGGIAEIILCSDPSKPFAGQPLVIGRLYDDTNMAVSLETPGSEIMRHRAVTSFVKRVREYVNADDELSIDCYRNINSNNSDFVVEASFGSGLNSPYVSERKVNLLCAGTIDLKVISKPNGVVTLKFSEGTLDKTEVAAVASTGDLFLIAMNKMGHQIRAGGKPIKDATLAILKSEEITKIKDSIELKV